MPGNTAIQEKLSSLRALSGQYAHEMDYLCLIEGNVQPGWIAVDVGACVGDYTYLFAGQVGPTGKVYAFEALEDNAELIIKNVNQYEAGAVIEVINAAVTDGTSPKVGLHPGRRFSSHEWNLLGYDVDGNPTPALFQVKAISLDQFFIGRQLPQIIKIDVEGVGDAVLRGARRTIELARPIILFETHNQAEWQELAKLTDLGFDIWNTQSDTRITDPKNTDPCFHAVVVPRV